MLSSSVDMPSCSILKYDSNNLGALEHFHVPHLGRLEVKCGQCRTWRGTLQLAAMHPIFAGQGLTCLHLQIKRSERLLADMLGLVPALKELSLGLSSPRALSRTFFLAFVAGRPNASAMTEPPSRAIVPLCRELKKLHLHYKRWLRDTERRGLILAFSDIVESRHPDDQSGFSLCLSFDEGPKDLAWRVHRPVEKFDLQTGISQIYIGFSSPHGIVPISNVTWGKWHYFHQFRELEYITIIEAEIIPIELFFHFQGLKELRLPSGGLEIRPNTQIPFDLPLCHTLKALHVAHIEAEFLAGQIFHRLERYKETSGHNQANPRQHLLIEMPVCTRLVVTLSRLANLKLPQICELDLGINFDEHSYIWENRIAFNVNLSGLRLLYLWNVRKFPKQHINDFLKILISVPALETLIIDASNLALPYVNLFEAFILMDVRGTSRLSQLSWERQTPRVLCPRLQSLKIEGIDLTKQPDLIPVLKDIVTLRAISGSPLKSFTFYFDDIYAETKWELIDRSRRFFIKKVVPAQRFQLQF
jgi:hypothetical protein